MPGGNAIGSGAVILTANADGLVAGLQKASGDLDHFGKSAGHGLSNSVAGAAESGGMLSRVVGAIKAHPFVTAGLAAGASLAEGFHLATDKLGELNKINKQAGVLGVKPSELQGFQMLLEKAGIAGEDAAGVFAKMGRNLVTAVGDGGDKLKAFEKIGLDPHKLAGKEYTEQIKAIADGLNKLPHGAAQAAVAMDIFGKSGYELLPLLQRGSAGIDEFIEHAKASGAILSDAQFATAGKAAKAWKEAKEAIAHAWEGLQNRLAIAAAPVVKFVSEGIGRAVKFLGPVFDWISRAMERVGVVSEVILDMIGDGAGELWGWFKRLVAQVDVFGGEWPTVQEIVTTAFRVIAMVGGYTWDALKIGAGTVIEAWMELEQSLDFVRDGMMSIIRLLKDLPAEIKPSWADSLVDGMDRGVEKGKQLRESLRKWGEEARQTVYGSTFAEFEKRLAKALAPKPPKPEEAKPGDSLAAGPAKFAAAIEKGSKEAYSLEMRARYGDYGKPTTDVPNQTLREVQGTNKRLDGLKTSIDKLSDQWGSV
jgi:hypothetical protein